MFKSYILAAITGCLIAASPVVALAGNGGTKYPNNPCKRGVDGKGAPALHCVNPDWQGIVRPGEGLHVSLRKVGDVHCYNNRTGKAYNQGRSKAGPYWYNNAGRAVAGFDRINNDFVSFTDRTAVICAAWLPA